MNPILHITFIFLLFYLSQQLLTKPDNIEANLVILYNNNALPYLATSGPKTYTISYANSYNGIVNTFYGINDYKQGDQMYYENFQSKMITSNNTAFSILITVVNSTSVKKFSISYLTVAQTLSSLIFGDWKSFATISNINSGSGTRHIKTLQNYLFSSIQLLAMPLITGFYITSSTQYYIYSNVSIISAVNYQVYIETASDCQINRLDIFILFYNPVNLIKSYYILAGVDLFTSSNLSANNFTVKIYNQSETIYLLALRAFSGTTSGSPITFDWQVTAVNSTGNFQIITVQKAAMKTIGYSYFQIGQLAPVVQVVYQFVYLPIIAGIAGGIITIAGISIFYCRYVQRNSVKPIIKDNFRQLPSISL